MPTALTPQQMSFTLGQILLNLCLSFALSYLVAKLYRRFFTGPGYSFSFFITLLVTPVVVCMIMMAIGSNVALSLGLVGALSIIRFRTVVKDTRDLTFLFLNIGIGLCCGSGGYGLAIFGTGFVGLVLFVLHMINQSRWAPSEYILVVRTRQDLNGQTQEAIEPLVSWHRLHGAADLGPDDGIEYTYRLRLSPSVRPETLLNRLRALDGVSHSTLISPESQLAV
jgi:uncharacterized membrane protein YhiD involved in acid resistance